MADKEKKVENVGAEAPKETKKIEKPKKKKESVFKRFGAWLRTCKAELKKIVWASWKNVRSNTAMVLVTIIVLSAFIGVVDLAFSKFINILSELVNVF